MFNIFKKKINHQELEQELLKKLYGLKGLGPYQIVEGAKLSFDFNPAKPEFSKMVDVPANMGLTMEHFKYLCDRGLIKFTDSRTWHSGITYTAYLSDLGKIRISNIINEYKTLSEIYTTD